VLPLGPARRADLEIALAPAPAVTFTEAGALALIADWGLPLASLLALRAAESTLDDPLWTNGPTARSVVEGAGLMAPGSAPPRVVHSLPALDALALALLRELATGITVAVSDTLDVAVVDDGAGRKGVRLSGRHDFDGERLGVTVRFGDAYWLDDPDAGVTLWILKPAAGVPPVALDLGLDAIGVGALLDGGDGAALIDGPVTIGRAGGLLFFRLDFMDGAGQPALSVDGVGAALEVEDAEIAVDSGEGDAFIQKLLPPELQAPFDLAVEARAGQDVQVHGGIGGTPGQIELTFPLDLDIGGIVRLDEVFISAGRDGGVTTVLGAISGGASLGPVAVAVTRVGARARVQASGTQLAFKPPDGLGLSISTPAVRAGGFLLVDEQRGRYVGAIELAIVEKFSIVAIGIVTTKRPDGTPGFSLLLLIAVTFPVPIPLGYGFFFAGAGGLLGLNRGVDLDRLRLGLRTGAADSILFPTDIVRRIDTIVRDLEEVFPVAEGRFLVAPMAMITWSTPPLITAKVGLIIEIGAPLRLALLGALRLALPTPETAVVDLKVAFLGAIDIPAGLLSFDASIYDSYLGYGDFKLSLEGDMALRISWGAQPDFVTSVGGFHPSYRPGTHLRLPPLRRMSLSLLKDNPRVTLSAYFAVTTNTVQFGARLELVFRAGDFSIEGDCGFDVLVQIVPLHLDAHIWARLAVKAGGAEILTILLDLTLEGPTPWIARGTASFKILFFSVDVSLEARVGQEAPAALPEIAVLPQLLEALAKDEAWTAELSAGAHALVLLRSPPEGTLVLDAAGVLTVSQKLVPLDTDFSLVGVARPSDVTRVGVGELRVGAAAAPTRPVTDAFAPAAFRQLSDADKLRAPAFEQRPAGVQSTAGETAACDAVLSHPVEYERIVFDTAAAPAPRRGTDAPAQGTFEALVPGGRIGASAGARAILRGRERGSVLNVMAPEERFGVARIDEVAPLDAAGAVVAPTADGALLSLTDAEARRTALIAAGVATDLQVLPEAQLAA
jgi:hypothetical protein